MTSQEEARTRAAQRGGLPVVLSSFALNGLLYGSLLSRYAEIADGVRAGEAAFGVVLSVGAFGGLVGSLLAPAVIRRTSETAAATIFGVGFALLALGVAGSPTLVILGVVLFVMTLVDGAQDVAMNALAARVQQARGTSVMGRAHGVWSVSLAAGTGLGALAASIGTPLMLHLALVAAVLIVVQLIGLRRASRCTVSPEATPDEATTAPSAAPGPGLVASLGGVLRGRARGVVLALILAAVAASYVESPGQEWTGLLLARGFGADPGLAAIGPLAFSVGLVGSRLVLDRLLRSVNRAAIASVSGLLVTVSMAGGAAVGAAGGPAWVVIAALLVSGLGAGPVFPILFGAADVLSTRYSIPVATTASVVSACSRVGAISAPVVVGASTAATSLLGVLVIMALGGLMIAVTLGGSLREGRETSV